MWVRERNEEAAQAQFEFKHEHHFSLSAITMILYWLDGGGVFSPSGKGENNTSKASILF